MQADTSNGTLAHSQLPKSLHQQRLLHQKSVHLARMPPTAFFVACVAGIAVVGEVQRCSCTHKIRSCSGDLSTVRWRSANGDSNKFAFAFQCHQPYLESMQASACGGGGFKNDLVRGEWALNKFGKNCPAGGKIIVFSFMQIA